MRLILLCVILSISSVASYAGTELQIEPYPLIVPDNMRDHYLKVVPGETESDAATVYSYVVTDGDKDSLTWVGRCPFSLYLYLGHDGQHFVRLKPYASGSADSALVFYRKSEVIRVHLLQDLIPDTSEVPIDHSGHQAFVDWRRPPELGAGFKFRIWLHGGREYSFNLQTGAITNKKLE